MPAKAKRRRLPTRALVPATKFGPRLSIAEQDLVCQLLAEGERPSAVRERLRKEQGTEITTTGVRLYLKSHAGEIEQRRAAWNAGTDKEPLRHKRPRLRELVRWYALLVRECYREVCKPCAGRGWTGPKDDRKRCVPCRATGWALPKQAVAYELGDDVEHEVLRLTGLPPPPGAPLDIWDRALVCLKQIREEVGDAKPERSEAADVLLAAAEAKKAEAFADQMRGLTSAKFIELCVKIGAAREARWAAAQRGGPDGRGTDGRGTKAGK